ncbi:MAG: phosphatase PAP2 family protein [Clostridia bacterium]|nr:phosphatase PAP2 family protein [Clostridia bacterium]
MRNSRKYFGMAAGFFSAFGLWTAAVCIFDVAPIGPLGSVVGFASLNRFVHDFTGVHLSLYRLTDWLSLIPFLIAAGFALLGLGEWIGRKQLRQVEYSLFVLGGFYTAVIVAYVFFEKMVVNYRPILIEGRLEASYPSSTTMLVLCILPTAILQLRSRIKNPACKTVMTVMLTIFAVFMVIARLISGVHWFSDIIGGVLLSTGLVMLYMAFVDLK